MEIDTGYQTQCFRFPPSVREKPECVLKKPQMFIELQPGSAGDCVNVATTPKSGTHLLIKILGMMGVSYKFRSQGLSYAPHICQYADVLPYGFLNPENLKAAFDLKEKYIVTVRDPKDFLISYIQWIDKNMERGTSPLDEDWEKATMEEKVDQLLAGGSAVKLKPFITAPWFIGNYLVAQKLMELALPNMLFLKFEDLVGPEYGGSCREKQIEAFTKLCEFTGAQVTSKKIDQLINNIPGGTLTYINQKKVGKWKDYFSEKNLEHYNIRLQSVEKGLGY